MMHKSTSCAGPSSSRSSVNGDWPCGERGAGFPALLANFRRFAWRLAVLTLLLADPAGATAGYIPSGGLDGHPGGFYPLNTQIGSEVDLDTPNGGPLPGSVSSGLAPIFIDAHAPTFQFSGSASDIGSGDQLQAQYGAYWTSNPADGAVGLSITSGTGMSLTSSPGLGDPTQNAASMFVSAVLNLQGVADSYQYVTSMGFSLHGYVAPGDTVKFQQLFGFAPVDFLFDPLSNDPGDSLSISTPGPFSVSFATTSAPFSTQPTLDAMGIHLVGQIFKGTGGGTSSFSWDPDIGISRFNPTTSAPEPSTVALLASGSLLLFGAWKRRLASPRKDIA